MRPDSTGRFVLGRTNKGTNKGTAVFEPADTQHPEFSEIVTY